MWFKSVNLEMFFNAGNVGISSIAGSMIGIFVCNLNDPLELPDAGLLLLFLLLLAPPPPKFPTKLLKEPRPVTMKDESAVNTVFIFVRCVLNASTNGRLGRVGRGRDGLTDVLLDVVVVAAVVDDGIDCDASADASASTSDPDSESASNVESVSIEEFISNDESNANSVLSACFAAINRPLLSLDNGDVRVSNINV